MCEVVVSIGFREYSMCELVILKNCSCVIYCLVGDISRCFEEYINVLESCENLIDTSICFKGLFL